MSPELVMTVEEQTALENATRFVRENLVSAVAGRKCVDGRYQDSDGMIARPGGDFGYVMVLLALNKAKGFHLTPGQCVEKVYMALGDHNNRFYMHTDTHAAANHGLPGCGHIAKAMDVKLAESYGLKPMEVQAALMSINLLQRVQNVILQGEHREQGVLVITGEKSPVRSQNGEKMYFIYDQTRDERLMRDLVGRMGIPGLIAEDFIEVSQKQLAATLQQLAKGKPIFEVDADDPEYLQIKYLGKV